MESGISNRCYHLKSNFISKLHYSISNTEFSKILLPSEKVSLVKIPSSQVLLTSFHGSPSHSTPLLSIEVQLNCGTFVVEDKLEVLVISDVLDEKE